MHDIRFIREHPDVFVRGLERRGTSDSDAHSLLSRLVDLDHARRSAIVDLEQAQKRQNDISKEIGRAAKSSQADTTLASLRDSLVVLKANIKSLEEKRDDLEGRLRRELLQIPNLPAADVPDGKYADDNVEHHRFGAKLDYAFAPKQHFDLGEAIGQMDFETAAKLSGARFVVLKKGLARLERALGQFMLDVHTSEPHNYTEVGPPLLVNDSTMFGTAQLPKFADDQFETKIKRFQTADFNTQSGVQLLFRPDSLVFGTDELKKEFYSARERYQSANTSITFSGAGYGSSPNPILTVEERMWLIPTAEVPLTNLVRESIIDEAQLPMRFTACTPCFRAEAGAAGKDTRGMIRQHQFTKVELVSITTPEQSKDEHERMLACAEEVLKKLDLHYRVMTLCTGDMGFASQKTYDIEVWLPGQNMYREISSCSICGEFQARRMNARYRAKEGRQVRHLHTLNGSGVAVGRALIAVMETYQDADGSITVPDALAPYMGGLKKIEKVQ
jgi:seryl-tRNA synthetase